MGVTTLKAQIITTIAGNGTSGYSGDGGAATSAEFKDPNSVCYFEGNLYVPDFANARIRIINLSTGIINTFAGTGVDGYSGNGGPATSAKFYQPSYVAADSFGNIIIDDANNARFRIVDPSGIVSLYAGNGVRGFSGDGGAATSAEFNNTVGAMAIVDDTGNVYISDNNNNRIRKITTSGIVTTIAGNGTAGFSGDGGAATSAELHTPSGLAIDAAGNIYVADYSNSRIRMINTSGIISTYAGAAAGTGHSGNGYPATSTYLNEPSAMVMDASGNLYFAEAGNADIRKINTSGIVSLVAGNHTAGFSGDGGQATAAEISTTGLSIDPCGDLYLAEESTQRIRVIYLSLNVTPSVTFNVTCNGGSNGSVSATPSHGATPYTYSWSGGGTNSSKTGLAAGTYTITVTDNVGVTGSATVTITQPTTLVALATTTANVTCHGGSTGSVSATPSGGTSPYTYSWSGGGTNSTKTGLAVGTYTVTVTDHCAATATATATITQPTSLSLSANTTTNVSCNGGSTGSVSSSPSGGTTPYTYSWSGGGTNSSKTGLTAGTYTITATDNCGATATATTTITQPTTALSIIASTTANASCSAGNIGSASSTASGGTSPYTYSWTGGGTSSTYTGLSAGIYTLTVTDHNGCTSSTSATILTTTNCCSSAIPLTFGASADYSYQLNDSLVWFSFVAASANIDVGLSNPALAADTPAMYPHSLKVYSGTCGGLTLIGSNTASFGSGIWPEVSLSGLTLGTTYYVSVSKYNTTGCRICTAAISYFNIYINSYFTTYGTQLPTNILTNEVNTDQAIPNTSLPVGKTPSSYGVSSSGGASYNVPIVIPPGTMGMVPNLSVSYNSQSVNGLLGYGWNLAGLSCISRMEQTPYHNFAGKYPDQTEAVTLTNSDWFALDGNRLITTSGSNGANGTTYATESETFNQVTSNGTIGSGPDWFQVKTKNGLLMEYGNTVDSRLLPVGQSTVYVWYIDKITDQFGNYVTFHYTNNNGEVHIKEIDYTGNTSAGITPYNSIDFNYASRTDANTTYIAGGALNSSVVLSTITVNSHSKFFKQYSFKYAYNLYTMLQEIDETGSDYTHLNPLQFSYCSDNPVVGSSCTGVAAPSSGANYSVVAYPSALRSSINGTSGFDSAAQFTLLDYNGDGKTDVIALLGTYEQATGGGEGPPEPLDLYDINWTSQELYTTGTPCPYFTYNSSATFSLGVPTSQGTSSYHNPVSNTSGGSLSQAGMDFNGDGKDDYAVSTFTTTTTEGADQEEDINIALSTGTSFATANVLKAYDMYSNSAELTDVSATVGTTLSGTFYIDLNGDGQMDVFNYHFDPVANVEYYRVWLKADSSTTTPQEQPSSSYTLTPANPPSPNFEVTVKETYIGSFLDFSKAIPMDLNGDGKTELVNVYQWNNGTTTNPQRVIVSFNATQVYGQSSYAAELDGSTYAGTPGNGIVVQLDNSGFAYNTNTYVASDSNYVTYDYEYNPTIDGDYAGYFSSQGLGDVFGITTSIDNGTSPYVLFGDFNGDGITDVLSYGSSWSMNFGKGGGNYASLAVTTLSSDNPFSYPTHYYYAHDVNGDGKTDILEFSPYYDILTSQAYTVINTYYSTGTSFVEGGSITLTGGVNPQTWQISFGDFNGDGVDDLLLENTLGDGAINGGPMLIYFYSGSQSRRLAEAVDGYNDLAQFTYQPLTNSSIYTQPNASSYRSATNNTKLLDVQPPIYVVTRLTATDGTGNHTTTSISKDGISNYISYTDTNSTTYTYQDAIYSRLGLGMLGFLNVTSYNTVTDRSSSTTYTVSPSFDNMVPSTNTVTAVTAATEISDGAYTITPVSLGGLRYYLNETETVMNDDIAGVTNTTNYTYDSYNNVTDKNSQISVGASVIETADVQTTYTTSATWVPAVASTVTTTVTYLSNPSYTRTSSNTWDAYGHLSSTTSDQGVTTTNSYDSHTGVLLGQTITASGCPTETSSFTYDSYAQYKASSTNPLGQVTHYLYNPMWGKIEELKTPDGLVTLYYYDAYGRSSEIITPDSITQTLTYNWITSGVLPLGSSADPFDISPTTLYYVTSTKTGSPTLETFYDWFDRKTFVKTNTLSTDVYSEQAYDAMGHAYKSANAYTKVSISSTYGDYDPVTITNEYNDILFRLTQTQSTCSSAATLTSTFAYTNASGNTTVTTTKPDGSTSSQTVDPAGMTVNATDYELSSPTTVYSSVNYNYYSNGHASSVVLNSNTINTFTYDSYGRQTNMTDVNYGGSGYTYTYNDYNQITSEEDPNTQTTSMTYDLLGRTTGKTSVEGTYTYSYSSGTTGTNLLLSQQLVNSAATYTSTISYSYDALHRPTSVDVNGLTTTYTYDAYNNVQTKTYPGSGFEITNTYSSDGYLEETDKTGGSAIWTAEYMNPAGQYVDYLLGNGTHTTKSYTPYGLLTGIVGGSYENIKYDFDSTNGNLRWRISEGGNLKENYTYDGSLNSRLSEAKSYYVPTTTTTADIVMTYDQNGNIVSKSDICAPTTTYTDGSSNNQITQVPNSSSLILAPQAVTYTSFNAPTSISLNGYSMTLQYGPDNNREQTVLTDPSSNTTTRTYGNAYEKTVYSDGSPTTEVNYIQCGGDLVAMYVNQAGADTMNYVYTDHLGSILAVNNVKTTFYQSFDVWGNYRNPTNGSYTSIPTNPLWMYRGFTGHEHMPELQLINANGRLYDPLVGSMLSPDITVQAPGNTQNYNRYSYCMNNPLKYSDPSGFFYFITAAIAANEASAAAGERELDNIEAGWNAALDAADGQMCGSVAAMLGWGGTLGGGGGGGGGSGVNASSGDPGYNDFTSGIGSDLQDMGEREAAEQTAIGNTGTAANSAWVPPPCPSRTLQQPSMYGGGAAQSNSNEISAIMGGNVILDPTAGSGLPSSYSGLDFSNAGAMMANMPSDMFIDNAYQFQGVPYLYGGYNINGIDCSGLVDKAIGFSTHLIWNTSGGAPPGFGQVFPSQNSPEDFANGLQYGDVLVWPGEHTVFVSGFDDNNLPMFFEAHGPEGSATGFTNFYSLYLNKMGYPNVYQQLSYGQFNWSNN